MFYSKSQAAFLLTCEKMFETWPRMYFWTFTWRRTMPDGWYPETWHRFIRRLCSMHGEMLLGVRVLEPHHEHGLHYHAIWNLRVSCHLVNRVARDYGIGRVGVEQCNMGAAHYLASYLVPRGDNKIGKGMRRWATIGGFRGVKTNAIEVDSPFHRNMELLRRGQKCGYKICNEIYRLTQVLGDFAEWPVSARDYARSFVVPSPNEAAVAYYRGRLPQLLQRLCTTHVVTPAGRFRYRLSRMLTWDNCKKPSVGVGVGSAESEEAREKAEHLAGIAQRPKRFGGLLWVAGRWYSERECIIRGDSILLPVHSDE